MSETRNRWSELERTGGPVSYSLDLDQDGTFVVRLTPEASEYLRPFFQMDHKDILFYSHELGQPFTSPEKSEQWGFGACATWSTCDNGDEIRFTLPTTDGGYTFLSVTATLLLMTDRLQFWLPSDDELAPRQVAHILGLGIALKYAPGASGIKVLICREATAWLRQQGSTVDLEVTEAMRIVFRKVTRLDQEREVWFRNDDDGVEFHTLGNCACMGNSRSRYRDWKPSYELSTHNVDAVQQQLTLLAGVFKLDAIIRNALSP